MSAIGAYGHRLAAALAAQEEENHGTGNRVGKHLLDAGFIEVCRRSRRQVSAWDPCAYFARPGA